MKETAQALRAYQDYEAQDPPRSLQRLAQEYRSRSEGVVPTRQASRLLLWSQQHAWQERITMHERALAAQVAREADAERKRARTQRLQVARAVRGKGAEGLAALSGADLARLPSAIVRLFEYADTTERKDLGEPDQKLEVSGPAGGALTIRVVYDDGDLSDSDS